MVRHVLFWNYSRKVKEAHSEKQALKEIQDSLETLKQIPGVRCVEMKENLSEQGPDLMFYSEMDSVQDVFQFQNHPLHEAHKQRTKDLVEGRIGADILSDEKV